MLEWIVFAGIGVLAGTSAGLLGLGGGLVIVPALLMVLQWQSMPEAQIMHVAISTSLMTISITSLSSLYAHHNYSNINWSVVGRLVPGLLLGGMLGAGLATMLTSEFLEQGFAIYALLVAITMWAPMPPSLDARLLNKKMLFVFANFAGVISALVGIGGGSLVVPYLVIAKESIQRAVGTAAACGFPISVAAVIGFIVFGADKAITVNLWQTGFIHWQAFLGIISTSIIFAPLGAKVAKNLPVIRLKQLFSLVLFSGALHLLVN